jgi:hypothetical protein
VHEIKLDRFRMAARIDNGRVQLLTRTELDWTEKYPSVIAALVDVKAKAAYIDGELCGVDDAGLPSFAQIQAATDGESGARLVYYAFDLLHLDGQDTSRLPLVERKALLEPFVADRLGLQFNGHETGDGELTLKHAGKFGFEGVVSTTIDAPYAPGKPRPLAKSQMAQPPGARHRRLVRSGRIAALYWGAAARLLHRRRQAHLRRSRRHRNAPQGSRRSPAPPGSFSPQDVASERFAAAQHALRIAACSFARALGRAEACRGDHIFDLDS